MKDLEQKVSFESEKRRDRFKERNNYHQEKVISLLIQNAFTTLIWSLFGWWFKTKTSIPGTVDPGIGYISGVRCFIWIDDSGINAGAITKMSVEKGLACIK